MTTLLILPILIPLITAIFCLFGWQRVRVQRVLTVIGMTGYAVVAGLLLRSVLNGDILVLQVGGWPAPFGISLVADRLSAIMVLLVALVGGASILFSLVNIDHQRIAYGYYPLINLLFMGISGAFLTGDMFNLYVWFEVLLISSFVLLGLGGEKRQIQGTFKYVVINLVASTIFITALGLTYGVTGTLNMADLAQRMPALAADNETLVLALATLYMLTFGVKAALFPLFFWMPASYHTPPVAVSAPFAGLLTKVGIYSLVRVFTLIFWTNTEYTHLRVLLVIAGLTMVSGVFGAMSQIEMRRILAFHSVSQVGYMAMGLALAPLSPLALAGTVYFVVHHAVVKSNLFLVSGVVRWRHGTADLRKLGGLLDRQPLLALLFFVTAMSLAGIPPLSGFWAKFALVKAGLDVGSYAIVAVALFTGVWTLYSMTKIWSYAFWQKPKQPPELPRNSTLRAEIGHLAPVALLMVTTIALGLAAGPLLTIAQATAAQLLNPTLYITAVLQG